VVTDETMGEEDPLLARLLAAATAGASPAGPADKRKPIRIVLDPDAHAVAKGNLCGQHAGFNLHGATKVAASLRSQILGPAHPATPARGFAAPDAEAPKLWPARPPPSQSGGEGGDWLN